MLPFSQQRFYCLRERGAYVISNFNIEIQPLSAHSERSGRSAAQLLALGADGRIINPVDQRIHKTSQHKCGDHIENRVLLQKYGGQDDGHAQEKGTGGNPSFAAQRCTVHDREMGGNGIIYVNARKQVRWGIGAVELRHQRRKYIFLCKGGRPQMMSVGEYGGHDEEHSHAGEHKAAHAVIIAFILKKCKQQNSCHITKPQ